MADIPLREMVLQRTVPQAEWSETDPGPLCQEGRDGVRASLRDAMFRDIPSQPWKTSHRTTVAPRLESREEDCSVASSVGLTVSKMIGGSSACGRSDPTDCLL